MITFNNHAETNYLKLSQKLLNSRVNISTKWRTHLIRKWSNVAYEIYSNFVKILIFFVIAFSWHYFHTLFCLFFVMWVYLLSYKFTEQANCCNFFFFMSKIKYGLNDEKIINIAKCVCDSPSRSILRPLAWPE